ncbi:hypothetical protein C8J57DRAFT_1226309 [Mycena rebaudengoi]|nr:hypothetical protein C8J57DRAFT_1226309 [Mycena rebaudengoi]
MSVLKQGVLTPQFKTSLPHIFVSTNKQHPYDVELPDAMVALLVATAVCLCFARSMLRLVSIYYRLTGERRSINFTDGEYEDTYRNHMKTLRRASRVAQSPPWPIQRGQVRPYPGLKFFSRDERPKDFCRLADAVELNSVQLHGRRCLDEGCQSLFAANQLNAAASLPRSPTVILPSYYPNIIPHLLLHAEFISDIPAGARRHVAVELNVPRPESAGISVTGPPAGTGLQFQSPHQRLNPQAAAGQLLLG